MMSRQSQERANNSDGRFFFRLRPGSPERLHGRRDLAGVVWGRPLV